MQSEYYIKPGDFRISDRSLQTGLKYLSKKYSINYKNIRFQLTFTETITFTNCYNKEKNVYYLTLPRYTYNALRFTEKGIQIDRIVDNACILATINNENVYDCLRMRYYFLYIARKYAHNTKTSIITSDYTINELLEKCCENLNTKILNKSVDLCTINQSIKNCRHKVITVGDIPSSEKKKLSHLKFNYEEEDYVKFLFSEGYSYRKIMECFKEKYDKSISIGNVSKIIKSTVH